MIQPIHYDAFDRVTFRLDGPLPQKSLVMLGQHCTKIRPHHIALPYNPRWPYVIEVFQPSMACFPAILEVLGATISAEASYAEIARDFVVRFHIEALRLKGFALRTVTLRYFRGTVREREHGHYYGKRARPVVLTLYADKPSKLATPGAGQNCLHAEIRLQGSNILSRENLRSVGDFVHFDFDAFWERHIRFWDFGSRVAIGRELGEPSNRPDTLRKRTSRMFSDSRFTVGKHFVLQQVVTRHPDVRGALKSLTAREWETAARQAALVPSWSW